MKLKTDCTKNYMTGIEALNDCGFKEIGTIEMINSFKTVTRILVEKDGIKYYYKGMNHYNTTVYSVFIEKIEEIDGWYNEVTF